MNDIVVNTITRRRINKRISNKSVGYKRMNLPNGRLSAGLYQSIEIYEHWNCKQIRYSLEIYKRYTAR